jgi:hypothetical protein
VPHSLGAPLGWPARVPAAPEHPARADCRCYWCCTAAAAELYRDALARVTAMSLTEAARAAGARTPEEVAALAAEISSERQRLGPDAAGRVEAVEGRHHTQEPTGAPTAGAGPSTAPSR